MTFPITCSSEPPGASGLPVQMKLGGKKPQDAFRNIQPAIKIYKYPSLPVQASRELLVASETAAPETVGLLGGDLRRVKRPSW